MLALSKKGTSNGSLRRRSLAAGAAVLLSAGIGFMANQALAGPTFQEAAGLYNAGKYPQALSMFQSLAVTYPGNAWVHYYLALSHQAVGHIEQAKAEYTIVKNSNVAQLSAQAATGLAQLSGVRTTGSGSGSSVGSPSPTQTAPPGGPKQLGKIKKVLDFWAEW